MSSVLDIYPPDRVPAEAFADKYDPAFEDFVKHVQHHHWKKGHKISRKEVVDRVHKVADEMGISHAQGRGFFGNLWNGVKQSLANVGSDLWDKFKADPMGSLAYVGKVLAPVAAAAAV
jgi:protein-disulfide isomerase-like protein with CxxC motif